MTARILLVEDDAVAREVISALLGSKGYEVDVINEGFAALRMAQEKAYDLVFVDYHLPEMDGYALARLLRTLSVSANPTLKMVAVTADRFGLAARRGADTIFDRILAKPLDPDALFAVVAEFIAEAGRPTSMKGSDAPEPTDEGPRAGQSLWRIHGLNTTPSALVLPAPAPEMRARLAHCFRLVETDEADFLIVLDRDGFAPVETLRTQGKAYLQPILVLDPVLAPQADLCFDIGDHKSWTAAAAMLARFADRRGRLNPGVAFARDFDTRVTAFLYVADRTLDFIRDGRGPTQAVYAAGFPHDGLIETVKRLAGIGRVSATLTGDGDARRLTVTLTGKGRDAISDEVRARYAGG